MSMSGVFQLRLTWKDHQMTMMRIVGETPGFQIPTFHFPFTRSSPCLECLQHSKNTVLRYPHSRRPDDLQRQIQLMLFLGSVTTEKIETEAKDIVKMISCHFKPSSSAAFEEIH